MFVSLVGFAEEPSEGLDVEIGLDREALPREVTAFEGEIRGLWRDGRIYIGGQPDESALKYLQDEGVTAVVNLSTPAEVDDRERIPFDEASVVAELGMDYVHIPLGGEEHPYSTEAVARFSSVLERHDGLVFLHCTVGWRASYMWSAYLISEHEFGINQGMARGKAMAISDLPIEGLLGQELEFAVAN
jgi:protein tyrosine phosphatase (PTP) superfamily phosphohydrolase (DUF442 family)